MTALQSKRTIGTSLIGLFVLSLLIRLAGIDLEPALRIGRHVACRYTEIAENIVTGNGSPDAPGAPDTFGLWYATERGTNHLMIALMNVPILLLAAMGPATAIRMRISQEPQWPIWAAILFFIGVHVVTLPLPRYRAPVMAPVMACAAFFLTSLDGLKELRWPYALRLSSPGTG